MAKTRKPKKKPSPTTIRIASDIAPWVKENASRFGSVSGLVNAAVREMKNDWGAKERDILGLLGGCSGS